MPIPNSYLLTVLAYWPTNNNDGYDLSAPSPWQNINIPTDTNPTKPAIAIRFSHAIASSVYQNNTNISSYFFLTSQSNPSATNITNFNNVSWDSAQYTLSFQPAVSLEPGDTYTAFLSDRLPDAAGRKVDRAYTWTFSINSSGFLGVPQPTLVSPVNQTSIVTDSPTLTWSIPKNYSTPSGDTLYFTATIFKDQWMQEPIWSSTIPSFAVASGAIVDPNSSIFSLTPAPPSGTFANNSLYYWSVRSFISDASGNILAVADTPNPSNFLIDIPLQGVDGQVYPLLSQNPVVNSPMGFFVTGVLPGPGFVVRGLIPNIGDQPILL